eukprot:g3304.t1
MCAEIFDRCVHIAQQCMTMASVKAVDEVVLVGGSTRIPELRRRLRMSLLASDQRELCRSADTTAVAEGAAIQAAILSDADTNETLRDVLMLDVLPLSLGVKCASTGNLNVVIPRNSPVPCRMSRIFRTSEDNQVGVTVEVYESSGTEGAAPTPASECLFIGSFDFFIPKRRRGRAGEVEVVVIFEINASGVVRVYADTGETEEDALPVWKLGLLVFYVVALFALYVFVKLTSGIVFSNAFGGAFVDPSIFTFTFQYMDYPDVLPNYNTETITIYGNVVADYTVHIPSQGDNTFSSLLFYLHTRDVPVMMSNVTVLQNDCRGVPNGDAIADACGVCEGDNLTYCFTPKKKEEDEEEKGTSRTNEIARQNLTFDFASPKFGTDAAVFGGEDDTGAAAPFGEDEEDAPDWNKDVREISKEWSTPMQKKNMDFEAFSELEEMDQQRFSGKQLKPLVKKFLSESFESKKSPSKKMVRNVVANLILSAEGDAKALWNILHDEEQRISLLNKIAKEAESTAVDGGEEIDSKDDAKKADIDLTSTPADEAKGDLCSEVKKAANNSFAFAGDSSFTFNAGDSSFASFAATGESAGNTKEAATRDYKCVRG